MPRPETPEQYQGSPDDVVNARRVEGYGAVRLEPSELQPGMPPCECHPADFDRPETSLGIIHEGDIVKMRRSEVVGYFRSFSERPNDPNWPLTHVWNEGRADFELVSDREAKRAAKGAGDIQPEKADPSAAAAQPA